MERWKDWEKKSPDNKELAKKLTERILRLIDLDNLRWNFDEDRVFSDYFHSVLAQLLFMFLNGGVLFSKSQGILNKRLSTGQVFELSNNEGLPLKNADVVNISGKLYEPILSIIEEDNEFSRELKEKIKNAKNIMIAGCISPSSLDSLIRLLKRLNFRGSLDIYDISVVPLTLIEEYRKAGFWKGTGIEINTYQADLFGDELGEGRSFQTNGLEDKYDIILADVLFRYVFDDDKAKNGARNFEKVLGKRGLLIVRDMQLLREISSEDRPLNSRSYINMEKRMKRFVQWLRNNFGINVTLEQVRSMRRNLFPSYPSRNTGEFITSCFEDLRLRFLQLTTPHNQAGQRVFPIWVFQKPDEPYDSRNLIPYYAHRGTTVSYI